MKKLIITGLAQETDFERPTATYAVLVIDYGKLRIRIDESSVQQLLEYALKDYTPGQEPPPGYSDSELAPEEDAYAKMASETGEDSDEETDEEDFGEPPEEPNGAVLDDTGISQL